MTILACGECIYNTVFEFNSPGSARRGSHPDRLRSVWTLNCRTHAHLRDRNFHNPKPYDS